MGNTEVRSYRPGLTPREQEILELIGESFSNRQIAEQLCISQMTVKYHIGNIYRKLQVNSRLQAAMKLLELDVE